MRRHTISRQPEENEDEKENEILKEIPANRLYGVNLKKIKSYKNN